MITREYSKRELFMIDTAILLHFLIFVKGYGVTTGEGYRTEEQQRIHREGWRFKINIFGNGIWVKVKKYIRSWIFRSKHQDRQAHDWHIWRVDDAGEELTDEQWIEVGILWCSLSSENRWGGNFGLRKEEWFKKLGRDPWHFERMG